VEIYCSLFRFYLPHGQHATYFDSEIEVMNIELIQLFVRIESFQRVVIFSDSISAIQSIAKFETLSSKRVTEIHRNSQEQKYNCDFPRGDAVVTFCLITGHNCLAAHLHRLLIYPSHCVLWSEKYSIMNKDHLQNALFK
jgi:hypothetical protein